MWWYFARRALLMLPTLFGVSLVVFTIMHLVPGGPVEMAIMQFQMGAATEGGGSRGGSEFGGQAIPEDALKALNEAFGYDKPLLTRYGHWLWRVCHLDFGTSYKSHEPVWDIITERFPVSIYFGLLGFVLSYLICVPLGILKGIYHNSLFDLASSVLIFIGYSIPGWALGMLLLVLLGGGSFWNVFPLGGFRSTNWDDLPGVVQQWEDKSAVTDEVGDFDWSKMSLVGKSIDQAHHTFLPVLCYMIGSFATLTVLTKNTLLESLGQDYVRTAFAKGLSERRVIFLHVMRNSLIPLATGLGHAVGLIMAGSYLIEVTFNIRGLGLLGYTSLLDREYPVALAILMINAFLTLLGNLLSDLLYAAIDPRIRFH